MNVLVVEIEIEILPVQAIGNLSFSILYRLYISSCKWREDELPVGFIRDLNLIELDKVLFYLNGVELMG